jgi:hypothetical protein
MRREDRCGAAAALWIKVGTKRVSRQTHDAARKEDTEGISDQ